MDNIPNYAEPGISCTCGGCLILTRKHSMNEYFVCPTCGMKWALGYNFPELTPQGYNKAAPCSTKRKCEPGVKIQPRGRRGRKAAVC